MAQESHQIYGTYFRTPFSLKGVKALQCDIRNRDSIKQVLESVQADRIFHLAGQTTIPASWQDFEGTFAANLFGTYYLLDILRDKNLRPRVVIAGSSSEYGTLREGDKAHREHTNFHPANPYALSKVSADLLGELYFRVFQLPVLRVIPFYIIGPRKEPDAPSDFAKAIARHARGEEVPLGVGNLGVLRDVVDVRDAVEGLCLIAEKGEAGTVYNLCGGRETSLREILDLMLKISGSKIEIIQDASKLRKGDETRIIGNPDQLRALGWRPSISLEETLDSILKYWSRQER